MNLKKKLKINRVILSFISIILGFLIAFSYRSTQISRESHPMTDGQWEQNIDLKNSLIEQEEENRKLQIELHEKQDAVREFEKSLADEEQKYFNLAEDAQKYRMFLGKIGVKGEGVNVTLSDGEYDPEEENINQYLVHEHHVFKVINELYISGASAVAINGQRLTHHSYIVCDGPVITVDGNQHPAPFEITAIGEPEVLSSAMNITGGVKDQLVSEQIVFSLQLMDEIQMAPVITKK